MDVRLRRSRSGHFELVPGAIETVDVLNVRCLMLDTSFPNDRQTWPRCPSGVVGQVFP